LSVSLLDTSILISAENVAELPPTAAVSVITLGELHAGVLLARSEGIRSLRQHKLAAIRAAFEPIEVDEAIAERYGDLLAFARSRGRTEKAADLLIAATAAATERVLHTLDRRQAELARAAGISVSFS
jgi:predicted nucleic acid-binding protein